MEEEPPSPIGGVFRVGGGVSPPRVTDQRNPEFSEAARAAKFQGVVVLMLVVDKEGTPTKQLKVGNSSLPKKTECR